MRMFRNAAVVIAALVCLTSSVRASVSYQYVSDQTSYTGSTSTVNIYLAEILTGGSQSVVLNDRGLFGAGFGVQVTSGNATISSISYNLGAGAANTGSTLSTGFHDGAANSASVGNGGTTNGGTGATGSGTNAALVESVSSNQNGIGNASQTTSGSTVTNLFFLGSLTIANAGSSTFSITDLNNAANPSLGFNGSSGNTVTKTSTYDLDFNGQTSGGQTWTGADNSTVTFQTTASAVPEPSSMALCGLAACCMGYGAYRRRKAKGQELGKPEETAPTVA